MPSRKQRRRRAKERRHEYEYVYVDDEGNELEVADDASPRQASKREPRQSAARGVRPVPPPTWRRVGKRGLIIAPLMFLTVSVMDSSIPLAARVFQTITLLALFLPFSYFLDSMVYRRSLRQRGEEPATGGRR